MGVGWPGSKGVFAPEIVTFETGNNASPPMQAHVAHSHLQDLDVRTYIRLSSSRLACKEHGKFPLGSETPWPQ